MDGIASASAIFHSRIGAIEVFDQSSWLSTEKAGLLAALGYSVVETGITLELSDPVSLNIS